MRLCSSFVQSAKNTSNRLTHRSANIQQLEESLKELENVTEKLDTYLKASEERNASAVERLQQSEASRNTVVT